MKHVRIAILGDTSIDRQGELTRSGAIAVALATLPATEVTLRAVALDPAHAQRLTAALSAHGIHGDITSRDSEGDPATIRKGDILDIWGLFDHDIVILDFDDAGLRHFLTDLPAHTKPDVRLFGTLTFVQGPCDPAERDVALRFDTLIGTDEQFRLLTGKNDGAAGLADVEGRLHGSNLRAAIMVGPGTEIRIAALDQDIWCGASATVSRTIPYPEIVARATVGVARREDWPSIGNSLIGGDIDGA